MYSVSSWNLAVHDVEVTNVTADRGWVYQGPRFSVNINVTVLNKGDIDERYVVLDLFYNSTLDDFIGWRQIWDLPPGENNTIIFIWYTKEVPICYSGYNLTTLVYFNEGNGRTLQSSSKVQVRILGDINGDGDVDILDAIQIGTNFGLRQGDKGWNPDADLNGDGVVNILDIIITANHFGQSSSS